MSLKIAVAHHKKGFVLNDERLIPIHAGKALANTNLNLQGDDEGDNISWKNPWYCELTALYWLWKNVDADYKGLIHYRRTFRATRCAWLKTFATRAKYTFRRLCSIWIPYNSTGVTRIDNCHTNEQFAAATYNFLDIAEREFQRGTNVIAPYPVRFYFPIRRVLAWEISGNFIELLDDIVKNEYPDFYPYYDKAQNGQCFHNANMEMMDRKTHDEYCTLLFGILKRHEEETVARGFLTDVSKDKCYSRMSGYLAEMLTNAFIHYCKATKRVKIIPIARNCSE